MKKLRGFSNLNDLIPLASFLFILGGISFFTADAGVKDSAQKVFMNFGSCAGMNPSSYSFVSRIKSDYNILVCENAMKWDATEGTQGNFSYSGGDQVTTFCTSNGMYTRGHTMCWGAQTPSWVQSLSRTEMLAAMKNHITNLMTHWKGKILEWDIVNEAVSDGSSSLKGTFWQQKIGNDFIDSAFTYAWQADSNVFLYYNDYSAENSGTTKSDYIYNMVKSMQQRHIPIHGVGLQCHLTAPITKDKISANIKRLGDLGLRVSCTETDMMNGTSNPSSWFNLVQACVENYNATTFMCWGFDDNHSWRGTGCNCQMWDGSGQPKTVIVAGVDSVFSNGDPTVAAKRQAFIKLTPSEINQGMGTPIALNRILVNRKEVQRFTINNNMLSFNLPKAQNIQVQVFDMRGKVVGYLNLGMQASGNHNVRWTAGRLPAGLYFAKIRSGDQSMNIPFTRLN